jgi:hypothetical protein
MDTPRESNWASACRASAPEETQHWTDNRAGRCSPEPERRVMDASADRNGALETMVSATGGSL